MPPRAFGCPMHLSLPAHSSTTPGSALGTPLSIFVDAPVAPCSKWRAKPCRRCLARATPLRNHPALNLSAQSHTFTHPPSSCHQQTWVWVSSALRQPFVHARTTSATLSGASTRPCLLLPCLHAPPCARATTTPQVSQRLRDLEATIATFEAQLERARVGVAQAAGAVAEARASVEGHRARKEIKASLSSGPGWGACHQGQEWGACHQGQEWGGGAHAEGGWGLDDH
eukprot:43895-Chlamydomonas_euryale.AAC.13